MVGELEEEPRRTENRYSACIGEQFCIQRFSLLLPWQLTVVCQGNGQEAPRRTQISSEREYHTCNKIVSTNVLVQFTLLIQIIRTFY
jgi:hypothetical protein